MRKIIGLLLLLALGACDKKTNADKLVGNWLYAAASGSSGLGATFRGDGAYSLVTLALTSGNAGDAQVENGSYSATDSAITATPTQWTCSGPDPASTAAYSFTGDNLVLTIGAQVLELVPNNSPATSSFSLTLGCFDASGNFTAHALGPAS